ncbi:hypothetical protein MATR_12140 [Marivirga tractuosa]|uniref:Lipocalin-like domain-containing protein n=1 Tax=Marivirga tractuosa (strain ATCC 23168 / DSM 4126 / NBRC 15989 / NCIMB 1408 / VKM B-1430 / H-43) TaxID=643867 RepID=E4TVP4_MARTH|nr:hypothetical protein [Marivirga tractuosa]ADR21157.1 hypothetical protein Ftrac_1162 [Marivirga tractuosa DSM 4126]BDD14389.1 hypothetical protein MATR_12140 [Marivirga tractuosa]
MKSFNSVIFTITIIFIAGCEYSTPPEMLMGKWYVASVKANGHEMIHDYLDQNTRYLVFNEEGTYQVGLLDSVSEKAWMIHSDQNELIMMDGSPFDDIKKWNVKASDELVFLSDKNNHFNITLNRKKKLPKVKINEENALIGKWVIDKVTVNGYDNSDKYAFPNRWILLADNGRFYNGNETGDQNVGYWETNSSLTKVDFFDQKDQGESFITFNIANNTLWYEKQNDNNAPQVRVYFKKVN